MRFSLIIHLIPSMTAIFLSSGCRNASPSSPKPNFTMAGVVTYADGSSAAEAAVAVTSLATARRVAVTVTDKAGQFQFAVSPGDYATTVTTPRGFAVLDKNNAPNTAIRIELSSTCHTLRGCTDGREPHTFANAERRSSSQGETFVQLLGADGCFDMCLPESYYSVFLTGSIVASPVDVHISANQAIRIKGLPARSVQQPPPTAPSVRFDLEHLVADIIASKATIIGLGEATHGTAELVLARGELSHALIRAADVRLIMFEVDAIIATALDDYVNGADVEIMKAVAALKFWVTDTYEFLQFLKSIRDYNTTNSDKVHIWGVDLQNTIPPVDLLLNRATALSIDGEAQAALRIAAVRRGKGIAALPEDQRSHLSSLLTKLASPQGRSRDDLLVAVAARSLAMQLDYWDGDMRGQYRRRRDAGMAKLASFITSELGVRRACLWAHDGHLTKDGDLPMLGKMLAMDSSVRYYGIGFYLYAGSTRAWDATAKIGVISHSIAPAPPYTLEGAIMHLTGTPDIAWVPLRSLPQSFRDWLNFPRWAREIGAAYIDEDEALKLRRATEAFDALVVLKMGHDSTPTPTGVRRTEHD